MKPLPLGRAAVAATVLGWMLVRSLPADPGSGDDGFRFAAGDRIAFVGNTLLDRAQDFGHLEALLIQAHADLGLVARTFAWSADEVALRPRPDGFGDLTDYLDAFGATVVVAAYGFNESFRGESGIPAFEADLAAHVRELAGGTGGDDSSRRRVILLSPVAHEDLGPPLPDGEESNRRLRAYTDAMRRVAAREGVWFIDLFTPTRERFADPATAFTFNGIHLTGDGYELLAKLVFRALTGWDGPALNEDVRVAVVEKNETFFQHYRPLNYYYIKGGRAKPYGVVNFPGELEKLDRMTRLRDDRILRLARGETVGPLSDDASTGELPVITGDRPVNEWLSPADELAEFVVDPRFEVNCFASEEDFPEIACPIQIRWDSRGRLWVSTSTTYPQVVPGEKPNDRIVVLEDVDGDGTADTSEIFADGLHIPLSFEFGDGGVYVSEQPHLTFLRDTDGDGRADVRRKVLTGFGTEDSHHALHDFTWTPDGDLVFRESIFHHSQVETPHGPVRVRESGFFRFRPASHRLMAFGSYRSTNPWGITFDEWGRQVGSHPNDQNTIQALNAPYPELHAAAGKYMTAYSGVCGQEFVFHPHFPDEMQGQFIRARYKPTQTIEVHRWVPNGSHFVEEKQPQPLIQSRNLSFIPVDIRFGPRGALYICDWYNPVKGHMQYSLRDTRRDRKSGRIWRITAKGRPLADPPRIAEATIAELLDQLKAYEYRTRYWARRELRERDPAAVVAALDRWLDALDPADAKFDRHRLEALWAYRGAGAVRPGLLAALLNAPEPRARAAAQQQLRFWHGEVSDPIALLEIGCHDESPLVRLEAAITASWIGTTDAAEAALGVLEHPMDPVLAYALRTSLESHTLKPLWSANERFALAHPELSRFLADSTPDQVAEVFGKPGEKAGGAAKAESDADRDFDRGNPATITIRTLPERLLYDVDRFTVKAGEAVKLVFENPDVTPHNLLILEPGAEDEVGLAANEMAREPDGLTKGFVPDSNKILQATRLLNQGERQVLRFRAPATPGTYPYICSFPGHWLVMKGVMIVE